MKAAYLNLTTTDPAYNLAMEQHVFDGLPRDRSYLMLWQNENTVVVGRHQDARAEVNQDYIDRHGTQVIRRLSGGGAVYHDLGNLNFTFITDARRGEENGFAAFCRPVARALARLGVRAEVIGRNDMAVQGKKFSGSAQYRCQNRVMHHGTILFDSDLAAAQAALSPPAEKLSRNGVASVRSRIANIRPYLAQDMSLPEFRAFLLCALVEETGAKPWVLSRWDLAEAERLRRERYALPEWNYGPLQRHTLIRRRWFEGCGLVEARMILRQGTIQSLTFTGDFFGAEEPDALVQHLLGCPLEKHSCQAALSNIEVPIYFAGLDRERLAELLTAS